MTLDELNHSRPKASNEGISPKSPNGDNGEEFVRRRINEEVMAFGIDESISQSEFTYFYGCIVRFIDALRSKKQAIVIENYEIYANLIRGKDLTPQDLIDFHGKLNNAEFQVRLFQILNGRYCPKKTSTNFERPEKSGVYLIRAIVKHFYLFFQSLKRLIWKKTFYLQLRLRKDAVIYYNQTCSLFDHLFIYFRSMGRCIPVRHYSGDQRGKNRGIQEINLELRYKIFRKISCSAGNSNNSALALLVSALLPISLLEGPRWDQISLREVNSIKSLLLFEENLCWDLRILGSIDRWIRAGVKLLISCHGHVLDNDHASIKLEKSIANRYFESSNFRKVSHGRSCDITLDHRTFKESRAYNSFLVKIRSWPVRTKVCFFSHDMSNPRNVHHLDHWSYRYHRRIYLLQRAALLDRLPSLFGKNFFVRGHPADRVGLMSVCIEKNIECSTNSVAVDLHAKLSVFDYFSTVFFVALRVGAPAVVVDSRDLARSGYSVEGLDFIQALMGIDCFFGSVEDLVRFVSNTSLDDFGSQKRYAERASVYREFFGSGQSPRDSVLALFRLSLTQETAQGKYSREGLVDHANERD